jgi:hypothetical protein
MRRDSLAREFLRFLGQNKKWWMIPILAVLLMLMGIVMLGATGVTPLMYTLF